MLQAHPVSLSNDALEYSFHFDSKALTVGAWIDQLKNNPDFRVRFNAVLREIPFPAFFWETPCITRDRLEQPFSFVATGSGALESIKADPAAFSDYFKRDAPVVSFPNLGKDAQLIVPCPSTGKSFAHIAAFVRTADEKQIDAFWKTAATEYAAAIGTTPRWLSTAGLGVYWFHLRVDSRPKYYRHTPYTLS